MSTATSTSPSAASRASRRGGGFTNLIISGLGVQDNVSKGYSVMAYSAQPASVAPAGEAWRSYPDRASLFDADGSHAAAPGNPCQIYFHPTKYIVRQGRTSQP